MSRPPDHDDEHDDGSRPDDESSPGNGSLEPSPGDDSSSELGSPLAGDTPDLYARWRRRGDDSDAESELVEFAFRDADPDALPIDQQEIIHESEGRHASDGTYVEEVVTTRSPSGAGDKVSATWPNENLPAAPYGTISDGSPLDVSDYRSDGRCDLARLPDGKVRPV